MFVLCTYQLSVLPPAAAWPNYYGEPFTLSTWKSAFIGYDSHIYDVTLARTTTGVMVSL